MNIHVMRRIRFCAGHRLLGHGGKCEHFHGHNYAVDIYVQSSRVDQVGRVIDFATLSQLFKGWVDEHWDHGFILYEHDANGIAAIQQVTPCKAYVLPYNPTAENMARYLCERVAPKLLGDYNVSVTKVAVWETDDACAEFHASSTRHHEPAMLAATSSAEDN